MIWTCNFLDWINVEIGHMSNLFITSCINYYMITNIANCCSLHHKSLFITDIGLFLNYFSLALIFFLVWAEQSYSMSWMSPLLVKEGWNKLCRSVSSLCNWVFHECSWKREMWFCEDTSPSSRFQFVQFESSFSLWHLHDFSWCCG